MEQDQSHDHPHSGYPQYPHEPGVRYTANGWAIKKQINYGDMIAFATLAVMIATPLTIWAIGQTKQTTVNAQQIEKQEARNSEQDERIDRQDERINRMEARTDRAFRSVDRKLDTINQNLLNYIQQSQDKN